MAIQHPGGTIVNTTFTGGNRLQIVNALNTHLKAAGWSAISGDGTSDVVLQSASTPNGNAIRIRLRETAVTNCACLNMQNTSGGQQSQNYFLLPGASKTFRIIANKYQFFCHTQSTTVAREAVGMGTLYVPTFLASQITGDLGWMWGNANADTSTTIIPSFRTSLSCFNTDGYGYSSVLMNSGLAEAGGGSQAYGGIRLVTLQSALTNVSNYAGSRWTDDTWFLSDALMAFGASSLLSNEAKIRGQLWGCMVLSDALAGETVLTDVNGHDWIAVTNSNVGDSDNVRGTLLMAIN